MELDNTTPLCPFCGSRDTRFEGDRDDDAVYLCGECERTFSGPRQ